MTEAEIALEVNDCARHIIEKQRRELASSGKDGFYDRDAFLAKLDTMLTRIDGAQKQAIKLAEIFAQGKLDAFLDVEHRVLNATTALSEAWAQVRCAEIEFRARHPGATKAMEAQQDAAQLAHSFMGVWAPRRTAEVARKIMDKAGIECSDEALKKWIRRARQEDEKRAKGIWPE